MKPLVIVLFLATAVAVRGADGLAPLIRVLGNATDPQVELDMLRGLRDATQGRPQLAMPAGWEEVERRLAQHSNPEVRSLARTLGLTFGSQNAREALRAILKDSGSDAIQRSDALRALVGIRDSGLPETLRSLLGDSAMRGAAIRALAAYDDPQTSPAVLAVYPSLSGSEKRDALNTLAARPESARRLLASVESGDVATRDLTADLVRQLRSLNDPAVNTALTSVYGTFREIGADKQAEIERYKRLYRAGGSTPGDAIRGRAVYAKVCQQCHTLFEVGGRVGPDLTGSNRGDLDYILQNIIDPNAVMPNEYRASTVELKDGRVVTGIVQQQDDRALTVATANEILNVPRAEVVEISESQLSMMPEGLLVSLADQEYRDLIYYLARPGQAPMLGTPDTANLFFNGRDLTLWQGDEANWRVENGEIVGRSAPGASSGSRFLRSDMILGDFRLVFEAQLSPGSGAQPAWAYFRAEPSSDGITRGYRVGLGQAAPGTLADFGGRGVLWEAPRSRAASAPSGGWSRIEIVAVGGRIRTAVDGRAAADLENADGARQGIVAFELPAEAVELRLRKIELELNPGAARTTGTGSAGAP